MMLPSPGPSEYQQDTARAAIRMLKLYRSEKNVMLRKEYAKAILSLAQHLAELPDAGGRWPPPPAPPPPPGRIVRECVPPPPPPPPDTGGIAKKGL